MSANNYILIKEKNGTFTVTMRDAENDYQLGEAVITDGIRDSIKAAQKIQKEDIVEYGIYFKLEK